MSASTARMTMRTTAMLMIGSGSLNGIASQLSLPSMSTSCLTQRWTPGPGGAHLSGTHDRLIDDALKQVRIHRTIGCWRDGLARLCQLGVAGIIERRSGGSCLLEPNVEI